MRPVLKNLIFNWTDMTESKLPLIKVIDDPEMLSIISKNPLLIEDLPLFCPSANDTYADTSMPINLSEVAYYAAMGMPRKKISRLMSLDHEYFTKNAQVMRYYYTGQALYELGLRAILLKAVQKSPSLAANLLARSAGSAEYEHLADLTEEEQRRRFGRVIY